MEMEIDTGASLSVMSKQEFRNLWPERPLVATDVTLHSYSGECIPVVGSVDVSGAGGDKYTQRIIPLCKTALWSFIGSRNLSKIY